LDNRKAIGCVAAPLVIVALVLVGTSLFLAVDGDKQLAKNREALAGAIRGICTTQYSEPWADGTDVEISGGMIIVRVMMKWEPQSYVEVQQLTDALCQSIVTMLMKTGDNPRIRNTSIFVHAKRPMSGQSPTGQTMVRSMGRSQYDPYTDAISFEPEK
jgi:hypothetical protein